MILSLSRLKIILLRLAWLSAAVLLAISIDWPFYNPAPKRPIRIGVLHSLTGTMAVSERPLVDAIRMAVSEINARGGVLGHPVQTVIADGRSDHKVFAEEAERLIDQEKVSVLFGCWTSSARKAVKPVVEKYRHLLFYPLQYEGLEESPHIIYTGSAPNQQIIPGTYWALNHLGKRVYLLGSDYIFPRLANRIVRDLVLAKEGQLLAEHYLPLGSDDVTEYIEEIEHLKPDVIINTINGDSNFAFFRALKASDASSVPVFSFSVSETELANRPELALESHYAAWSYFQSINTDINRRFVANYRRLFGNERVTSDPIEAAYVSVFLWAQAAEDIGTVEINRINRAVLQQSVDAPSGIISVDNKTRHVWKNVRIGRAGNDGQFKELQTSVFPIRPEPFPSYRSIAEWRQMINEMKERNGE